MELILKDINSVGIVVNDLYNTLELYTSYYGLGPWEIYESGSEIIAKSKIDSTTWEIVQPFDNKSIYFELAGNNREGLSYLGYKVTDMDSAIRLFNNIKVKMLDRGNLAGKDYAFFDTRKDLKHVAKIYVNNESLKPTSYYPKENGNIPQPLFKKVRQIGFVVNDIKEVARTYWDKYKIGPWQFFKYYSPKVKEMYYEGSEVFNQKFTTSAPIPSISDIEVELVMPQAGESVYKDHLEKYGEGLQHISFIYNPSFDEVLKFHKDKGDQIMQQGSINGAIYVYMGTKTDLKFISEPLYVPEDFEMPLYDDKYPLQINIQRR